DELPDVPFGVFLTKQELSSMRTSAVEVEREEGMPVEGFFAENHCETLMYLLLDGVPVAAVPAHDTRYLVGTLAGRYVAEWRSFLGDDIRPHSTVTLPGRVRCGSPPAPSPD